MSSSFLQDILRATSASLAAARETFTTNLYNTNNDPKPLQHLEKTPLSFQKQLINDPNLLVQHRKDYLD